MSETAIDRFCGETGVSGATVEALGDLDDTQIEVLLDAYRKAAADRSAELKAAMDDGLRVVPRLIRPAIKRVLSI